MLVRLTKIALSIGEVSGLLVRAMDTFCKRKFCFWCEPCGNKMHWIGMSWCKQSFDSPWTSCLSPNKRLWVPCLALDAIAKDWHCLVLNFCTQECERHPLPILFLWSVVSAFCLHLYLLCSAHHQRFLLSPGSMVSAWCSYFQLKSSLSFHTHCQPVWHVAGHPFLPLILFPVPWQIMVLRRLSPFKERKRQTYQMNCKSS